MAPDYGAFLGIIIAGAVFLAVLFILNRKKVKE